MENNVPENKAVSGDVTQLTTEEIEGQQRQAMWRKWAVEQAVQTDVHPDDLLTLAEKIYQWTAFPHYDDDEKQEEQTKETDTV